MGYDKKRYRAVWNKAASVAEVQKAFRISRVVASNRACAMRRAGIRMKKFKVGRKVSR